MSYRHGKRGCLFSLTDRKAFALQGRHFKFQCVNRLYTPLNVTLWTENLYGAEVRVGVFPSFMVVRIYCFVITSSLSKHVKF